MSKKKWSSNSPNELMGAFGNFIVNASFILSFWLTEKQDEVEILPYRTPPREQYYKGMGWRWGSPTNMGPFHSIGRITWHAIAFALISLTVHKSSGRVT
jgi:hypothetical protein